MYSLARTSLVRNTTQTTREYNTIRLIFHEVSYPLFTAFQYIIVSRKNISFPGCFKYLGFIILGKYSDFGTIVYITKKYNVLPRLFQTHLLLILLSNYFHFVSSYHEKLYLILRLFKISAPKRMN